MKPSLFKTILLFIATILVGEASFAQIVFTKLPFIPLGPNECYNEVSEAGSAKFLPPNTIFTTGYFTKEIWPTCTINSGISGNYFACSDTLGNFLYAKHTPVRLHDFYSAPNGATYVFGDWSPMGPWAGGWGTHPGFWGEIDSLGNFIQAWRNQGLHLKSVQTDTNEFIICYTRVGIGPNANRGLQLIKFTSSGDTLWSKFITGPSHLSAKKLRLSSNSELFILALSENQGKQHAFLAKMDTAGTLSWSKEMYYGLPDTALNFPVDLIESSHNKSIVSGFSNRAGYVNQTWIASINNSTGQVLWEKQVQSARNNPFISDFSHVLLKIDSNNFLLGLDYLSQFYGGLLVSFDSTGNTINSRGLGGNMYFISTLFHGPNKKSVYMYGTHSWWTVSPGLYRMDGSALRTCDSLMSPLALNITNNSLIQASYPATIISRNDPNWTASTPFSDSLNFAMRSICDVCAVPIVDFQDSVNNFTVNFLNETIAGSSFLWIFGDGDSSFTQFPSHVYQDTGTYQVCLISENYCGADTLCRDLTIACPSPQASFNYVDSSLAVQFSDNSGGATNWWWDFGDGSTSIQASPNHTYMGPGQYQVCLIASNSWCSDTTCMSVTVSCPPPTAQFNFQNSQLSVQFLNQTSGPLMVAWDFGDGNFSSAFSPFHTYANPGNYVACLMVTNICGTDTLCDTLSVNLTENEAFRNQQIQIYPNPATDYLFIRNPASLTLDLSLYNLLGEKLIETQVESQLEDIPIRDLAPGIYLFRLRNEGSIMMQGKLIIN